ncbi:substrate-binding domain-containing protein [Devosia sp. 2618]|uniref:substrate-binding domain-containing protein n=1 Tax=Devosia sp. 2618 TaxID=3156454 RepID=UPI00339274A5
MIKHTAIFSANGVRAVVLASLLGATALVTVSSVVAQDEKSMAVVVKVAGDPWWLRMEEGLVEYAAANPGIKVFMQGVSHSDAALQAQLIEDLVAQGVDAIGIVPISPQTLEPVLAKARAQGVVVVTHEGETQPTKNFDVEAFDNAEYGVHLMDHLAAQMGEEGEYAVFVGKLTNAAHTAWVDAAVAHQVATYPKMTLVGDRIETNEDAATAYRKTLELLVAYPNIKGFQGSSSNDPIGIGQAIEEAGLEERTSVVSTSLVSLTQDLLETGAVDLISFWDPKMAGQAMMSAAIRAMNHEPIVTGDDLGVPGYNNVIVKGDIVYGAAWVDVTVENMEQHNF